MLDWFFGTKSVTGKERILQLIEDIEVMKRDLNTAILELEADQSHDADRVVEINETINQRNIYIAKAKNMYGNLNEI